MDRESIREVLAAVMVGLAAVVVVMIATGEAPPELLAVVGDILQAATEMMPS